MKKFQDTAIQLFTDLLGYQPEMSIEETDEQIDIQLELEPQDSGMLIGYRGEALTSLQLITSLINQQMSGDWKPVRLNINDYREKRQQILENLAQNTAEKVMETGEPVSITNLSSFERRIIHSYLNEIPEVETHSEGESPRRVLVVSLSE